MFRKILETIFSKGFTAVCNLFTLLITAKYLGASGRGEMAIIVLGISIVGIFQSIFSGAVMTYLIPRYKLRNLLFHASWWNVLMALIVPVILVSTALFPRNYFIDLIILSFILGSIALIQSSLLGLERITAQNLIEITRAFSIAGALTVFILFWKDYTIAAVVNAFYWAYGITFLVALSFFLPSLFQKRKSNDSSEKNVVQQFLKIGFQMQLNNISQMINYRFCYYLIEKFLGLAALGILSVATSLIEVIWIVSKGISTIHYSKSVNLVDAKKQVVLTQKLARMSFILTLPAILILLALPNELFGWLLGKDFGDFKPIFLSLAPGVLALATFTLFNHHFSSVEKNMINVKGSIIGNIITIIVGFFTISFAGILAGGIATSVGYLTMFFYLLHVFNKENNLSYRWIYFSKSSIRNSFDLKEF